MVVHKLGLQSNLAATVKQRKLQYLGHIMRKPTRPEKDIIERSTRRDPENVRDDY